MKYLARTNVALDIIVEAENLDDALAHVTQSLKSMAKSNPNTLLHAADITFVGARPGTERELETLLQLMNAAAQTTDFQGSFYQRNDKPATKPFDADKAAADMPDLSLDDLFGTEN